MTKPDSDTRKILQALEANPSLKDCFLEMIDAAQDSSGELNKGDDAEDAIVAVINKTGQVLLQEWAEKKSNEADTQALEQGNLRPHTKKKSSGIPRSETSS
jgi:hypothetical protein